MHFTLYTTTCDILMLQEEGSYVGAKTDKKSSIALFLGMLYILFVLHRTTGACKYTMYKSKN